MQKDKCLLGELNINDTLCFYASCWFWEIAGPICRFRRHLLWNKWELSKFLKKSCSSQNHICLVSSSYVSGKVGLRFCCYDYCLLLSYSSWRNLWTGGVGKQPGFYKLSAVLCLSALFWVKNISIVHISKIMNASFIKKRDSIFWWITRIQYND